MKKGKELSHKDWFDAYYDGDLEDIQYDEFCEDTQRIYRRKRKDDGWDQLEEYKSSKAYWRQVEEDYKDVKF